MRMVKTSRCGTRVTRELRQAWWTLALYVALVLPVSVATVQIFVFSEKAMRLT